MSLRLKNQPRMPWSRVNSLIDGIFGFSATVLMLRLGAPLYERGELGTALLEQAPYYLLYGLGFLQIIGAWSVLRRVSAWTIGIDYVGMLLAFGALMMWATLPFTTDILAGALDDRADFASIVRLMAVTLLLGMLALMGLWRRQERLLWFREAVDADALAFLRVVIYTLPAWPLTVFALTYVNAWAALCVYIGSALLSLAPLEAGTTELYADG